MSNFVSAVEEEMNNQNFTFTENGGKQFATTNSSLLDLFATIGAMRDKTDAYITLAFQKAFEENPLLATRMVFYSRNIRDGGLGERRVFRVILKWLALNHPDIVIKNLWAIPEFGRFDDLFTLFGTPLEQDMIDFIKQEIQSDLANYEYKIQL